MSSSESFCEPGTVCLYLVGFLTGIFGLGIIIAIVYLLKKKIEKSREKAKKEKY